MQAAESQIGVPYVWGGETPGVGFDCSGLVQWAWAKAGIQIPRTTESQWPDAGPRARLNDLEPGDLLFYYNLDGDNAVDHVVMYVGPVPTASTRSSPRPTPAPTSASSRSSRTGWKARRDPRATQFARTVLDLAESALTPSLLVGAHFEGVADLLVQVP